MLPAFNYHICHVLGNTLGNNILRKETRELEDLLKGRKYLVMSNYHDILQNQCGLLLYNLTYYVRSFANISVHHNYINVFLKFIQH